MISIGFNYKFYDIFCCWSPSTYSTYFNIQDIQGTREKWLEEQLARRSADLVTALYKNSDMKCKFGIKDP